ncbi:MAG: CO2 hydration protein [Pseudanabaenaceae cyanobacterium SKYGB_i_bin29]|nr:CO2 hydration protein [Pseudanabaenaceae cyanobacterium SKYG29]MDW8421592.1 CO2 hydration protein [Pseudanabaenaceae cyanobacterium SKYGB_i_bin29]
MPLTQTKPIGELEVILARLEQGGALLPDSPQNVMEVVGILKSYGVVLDAYWRNLCYIAQHQFLEIFPFFKYFNGEFSWAKLWRHWCHDRINYEFAEYCMRAMLVHGGGKVDRFLDTEEFQQLAQRAITAKFGQLVGRGLSPLWLEQVRMLVYYSVLGQFWSVMSPIFLTLSNRYDRGEITTIPQVVQHILQGLVEAADKPIFYQVEIKGKQYEILPQAVGATFLMDAAVPYVEAVFFRSFPFRGTVSYNAQVHAISPNLGDFNYGALYADPLPIGGAGIPPTLLMQDMRHFLPEYLRNYYRQNNRQGKDERIQICISFQKSMFCVTTAAIVGLAPHPIHTTDPQARAENRAYLHSWLQRLYASRLLSVQTS